MGKDAAERCAHRLSSTMLELACFGGVSDIMDKLCTAFGTLRRPLSPVLEHYARSRTRLARRPCHISGVLQHHIALAIPFSPSSHDAKLYERRVAYGNAPVIVPGKETVPVRLAISRLTRCSGAFQQFRCESHGHRASYCLRRTFQALS